MTATQQLTAEDLRTLDDACQARLRKLNPNCDAYQRYLRASHKVADLLSALADAELAAEGIDPDKA